MRPAVLPDNLQWVDPDSRTLLALVVDELVEHGVLVAVAVHSEEPGTDEVAATLPGVRRDAVVRMPEPGLTAGDKAEILRRLSGRPPDAEVAAAIHRRIMGNRTTCARAGRTGDHTLCTSSVNCTPDRVMNAAHRGVEVSPQVMTTTIILDVHDAPSNLSP